MSYLAAAFVTFFAFAMVAVWLISINAFFIQFSQIRLWRNLFRAMESSANCDFRFGVKKVRTRGNPKEEKVPVLSEVRIKDGEHQFLITDMLKGIKKTEIEYNLGVREEFFDHDGMYIHIPSPSTRIALKDDTIIAKYLKKKVIQKLIDKSTPIAQMKEL